MQEAIQCESKKHKRKRSDNTQTVEKERPEEQCENTQDAAQEHKHKRKHKDNKQSGELKLKRKSDDNSQPMAKEQKQNPSEYTQTVSHIEGETVTIHQVQAKHFHQTLPAPEPIHESVSNPIICNLPDKNIYFVGRKKKIKKMKALLKEHQRCAIVGAGGVGKTQLAKEYAHHFQGQYKIIWCTNVIELNKDYLDLAETLNKESTKLGMKRKISLENRSTADIIKDLFKILRTLPSWLIIIDDVEKEEDILNNLPQSQSETNDRHILVTTRNQHWQSFHITPLEVLDRHASVTLLQNIISGELSNDNIKMSKEQGDGKNHQSETKQKNNLRQKDDLNQLADLLGDLPLALTQAGFYLRRCHVSVNNYIQQFLKNRQSLWNKERRPLNYPWPVRMTWEMSLKRLNEICPAAVQILKSICYLKNDMPFIYAKVIVPDNLAFDECIEALTSYSLISVNRDEETISIHPLFRYVLLDSQSENNHSVPFDIIFKPAQNVFQVLVEEKESLLERVGLFDNYDLMRVLFEQFDTAASHSDKISETDKLKLADLYYEIAKILHPFILPLRSNCVFIENKALRYYQKALDIYLTIQGEKSSPAAEILESMAEINAVVLDEFDKSYEMLIRALDIYKQFPDFQLKQVNIYYKLCVLYSMQREELWGVPDAMEKSIAMHEKGVTLCNKATESKERDIYLFLFQRFQVFNYRKIKKFANDINEYQNLLNFIYKYPKELEGYEEEILIQIAHFYHINNDHVTALNYYEQALAAIDKNGIKKYELIYHFDENIKHGAVYSCLRYLIDLYIEFDDEKKLKEAVDRVTDLCDVLWTSRNFISYQMAERMGYFYYLKKEYKKALDNYEQALEYLVLYDRGPFVEAEYEDHCDIHVKHKIAVCYYLLGNGKQGDIYTQQIFEEDRRINCGNCITVAIHHVWHGMSLH